MLSGNGRHRRPRQAPALVVAAGVTGSAIAIPLLGAGSASAADSAVWDRVAECESAGQWSANTGNGYFGGLQFSQETWDAFGGAQYAERADLASRSQQIAVAEKVLAAQGPLAWSSCGANAGLPGVKAPKVDPGALPTPSVPAVPSPTSTQGVGNGVGPGTGADEGKKAGGKHRGPAATESSATPATPATPDPSGTSEGTEKSAGKGAGEQRATDDTRASRSDTPGRGDSVQPADPGKAAGAPAKGQQNGGSTGTGTDSGAGKDGATPGNPGAAADVQKEKGEAGGDTATASPGTYTVRPGDNLWAIADAQDLPGGWPALYEANRDAVGADPDLILPGQNLDLGVK
ncbi:transglycosylase family protein [Streptomyces sp. NPDC048057]|uniref:transglycosylase family protein n=1 Tax=Streptomyces sp. NPDC048057 TaxID=3155628 RepID=UPI0033E8482D